MKEQLEKFIKEREEKITKHSKKHEGKPEHICCHFGMINMINELQKIVDKNK